MTSRAPAARRIDAPSPPAPSSARTWLVPLIALVMTILGSLAIGTVAAASALS